ncbi:MAG: choloylglycine hydrolase [Clostridiales bacterium]|nr:choloylglycine hydrolase [Clostridiales bacterium]
MCTAATYKTKDFYFGRTLDYEFSYGDEVTISPRNYPFRFRHTGLLESHYAIIGMAHVADGYPLYYDAVNEKGLGMAGLNFVGNAFYADIRDDMNNVAQFEFIPWILSRCASAAEAVELLQHTNLVGTPFSRQLPAAQLHWILADEKQALTVECVSEGLKIYDNPVGVLTNNPPFEQQMFMLNNYIGLSPKQPVNRFSGKLPLSAYSRGMGALGLPGDLSSASRFAKVAFTRMNSVSGDTESESVCQFFHILGSVEQQRGCCEVDDGKYELTIYTSCCNASRGIYYYTTYENHQITAVDMHRENLDGNLLTRYPLVTGEHIYIQN